MRQRTNVWSSSEKNMQRCAITKCNDYTSESLYKAFNEIIRNTDFPDVHGKKVLIKPNILSDALESFHFLFHLSTKRQNVKRLSSVISAQITAYMRLTDSDCQWPPYLIMSIS